MDIRLINISKRYNSADGNFISALNTVNLDINYGSYICFVGPSGSGKSTMLNIITGIMNPSSGDVYWGKMNLTKSRDDLITAKRRQIFGIVFQDARFVPELTVEENILLPLVINSTNINSKKEYYKTLLEKLHIVGLRHRLPEQLSGGEKRKVAIARALINNPQILVADEPTSNLDDHTAEEAFEIFASLNKTGLTVLIATHDERFADFTSETYFMANGQIADFQSHDR